jgi:hypothetical protein
MTTTRFGIAVGGLALLALFGAGCNLVDFDRRNLQDDPPPPVDMPTPDPARMCTPVVAEITTDYEAMCRHYCDELEATLNYSGKNQEPAGAVGQSCWELRCAPRCVTRDDCSRQCHSIGYAYQEMCRGVEIGPETMCPVTVDERVKTCLAGCDVFVPPTVTTPSTWKPD